MSHRFLSYPVIIKKRSKTKTFYTKLCVCLISCFHILKKLKKLLVFISLFLYMILFSSLLLNKKQVPSNLSYFKSQFSFVHSRSKSVLPFCANSYFFFLSFRVLQKSVNMCELCHLFPHFFLF